MSSQEKQIREFDTQRNMNRPLYFFGLTGNQLLLVFFISLTLFLIFDIWGLLLFLLLYFPCKKNYDEWRRGTPDYFTSYRVWQKTPKRLIDKTNLLKHL